MSAIESSDKLLGNGLENLQKRADKIKAKLAIKSKENEGTEVQLVLR